MLVLPVESVGDDVIVHKLPSPPKLNRHIELKNKSALIRLESGYIKDTITRLKPVTSM